MKKTNNRVFIILLVIILIVIGLIVFLSLRDKENKLVSGEGETTSNEASAYVEEVEDGIKLNKSTKLNEAKEINGLQISNIQLTTESGMTTLLADVKNNTGSDTKAQTIEITLVNEDGSEIAKVTGILNKMKAGESTQLNIATTSDYVNAYDFKVAIK